VENKNREEISLSSRGGAVEDLNVLFASTGVEYSRSVLSSAASELCGLLRVFVSTV
jgi:hypothetical protein